MSFCAQPLCLSSLRSGSTCSNAVHSRAWWPMHGEAFHYDMLCLWPRLSSKRYKQYLNRLEGACLLSSPCQSPCNTLVGSLTVLSSCSVVVWVYLH